MNISICWHESKMLVLHYSMCISKYVALLSPYSRLAGIKKVADLFLQMLKLDQMSLNSSSIISSSVPSEPVIHKGNSPGMIFQ